MGGEPTFVSIDDPTAPSGTPPRSGPDKRQLGGRAAPPPARAFRARGPAALRPGQVVSRRAAAALGARAATGARTASRSGSDPVLHRRRAQGLRRTDARTRERFMRALARSARPRPGIRLSRLRGRLVLPVARAAAARQRRSARRRGSRIRSSASGCARIFEQGLDQIVGYVLPLRGSVRSGRGLESGPWFLRERASVPDAGRFADGLPPAARFAAVGRAVETTRGRASARSVRRPSRRPGPARTRTACRNARCRAAPGAHRNARAGAVPSPVAAASIVRTALCVEPRDGVLLRLHAAGRARSRIISTSSPRSRTRRASCACRCCSKAIRRRAIRGIERDPHHARSGRDRSQHPSGRDLGRAGRATPTTLYEEARQTRLAHREVHARRAPHAAPAAATTSCSAAPRRPTARSCAAPICSRSLVAYWHNHPSLSYLFSGLFIGPTSQLRASTRRATIPSTSWRSRSRELERLAARRVPPWLVDRIFRNLLIDVDRQHAPRRVLHRQALLARQPRRGRLGLVELRAFEMPPARAHEPRAAAAAARADRALLAARRIARPGSCAGARSCTIASCCRTSSGRISRT